MRWWLYAIAGIAITFAILLMLWIVNHHQIS
jgi:hypothetical protein